MKSISVARGGGRQCRDEKKDGQMAYTKARPRKKGKNNSGDTTRSHRNKG